VLTGCGNPQTVSAIVILQMCILLTLGQEVCGNPGYIVGFVAISNVSWLVVELCVVLTLDAHKNDKISGTIEIEYNPLRDGTFSTERLRQ
jgi:hypothetical protein